MTPVRLVKNPFYNQVEEAMEKCATVDELIALLGRGRSKKGMFEWGLIEGELEIGQIAGMIEAILPAKQIVEEILAENKVALKE